MEIIIVLGSPNSPTGELSRTSKERLDHCLNCYKTGKPILCTGGWGDHFNTSPEPHATHAKKYLIAAGVRNEDLLESALSSNTVDDAVKVKEIIKNIDNPSLQIITSDYHIERTKIIFDHILAQYHKTYQNVTSNMETKAYQKLEIHEKNAINAIKRDGLYY